MMRILFNPTDWLAQHEPLCLSLLVILVCIAGAFGHA